MLKIATRRMIGFLLASAACTTAASAEGVVTGRVSNIQSYLGHAGLLIQLNTSTSNPDSCTSASWYIFPDDSPRAQWVQAALLSAMHSGKPVTLVLRGCLQAYPQIVHAAF